MKVYIVNKCFDWEGVYVWKVYDDEDMVMDKAKELNEEEQSLDHESDIYYTVGIEELIKKADTGMSTK